MPPIIPDDVLLAYPVFAVTPSETNPEGSEIRHLSGGDRDYLLCEEPLILEIDGNTLLTMRTPGQDEELVTGFLLAEGIVENLEEILSLSLRPGRPLSEPVQGDEEGRPILDRALVQTKTHRQSPRRDALRRIQEIRPSCGLCCLVDLHRLVPPDLAFQAGHPRFTTDLLEQLLQDFHDQQVLFTATGASHSAAFYNMDGELMGLGEDVGRHNALDKAIGQAYRKTGSVADCTLLLSGRAGYELIAKALRVGCPMLVSVSAASALSFDLCREVGATLIGFARGANHRVYWDEGRLVR